MGWFAKVKVRTALALIAALRSRIERFEDNGEASAVLTPSALAEGQRLWAVTERSGSIDPTPVGLDALETLARLHWARSRATSAEDTPSDDDQSDGDTDLHEAVRLFAQLQRQAPQRVPRQVAALVSEAERAEVERSSADDELDDRLTNEVDAATQALNAYVTGRDANSLDSAVEGFERALALVPPGHSIRAAVLSNLSGALRLRAEIGASREDADRAVVVGRKSLDGVPTGHPDRAALMFNLAVSLRLRSERYALSATSRDADISDAVDLLREAVTICPPDDPRLASMQSHLGVCLRARSAFLASLDDVDDAVVACELAVRQCRRTDPQRGVYTMELGNAHLNRHLLTGRPNDLDAAITALQDGVRRTAEGDPNRVMALSNLAAALRIRFGTQGRPDDLDAALRTIRQTLGTPASGSFDRALHLSNLGLCLAARYASTGDEESLDSAVDAAQQAVDAAGEGDVRRAGYLSNLADLRLTRFRRLEEPSDLDEAIRLAEQALQALPDDHVWRAMAMSGLSNTLLQRYQTTADAVALQCAVDLGRSAAQLVSPGNAGRVAVLGNLADLLLTQIEHHQDGPPETADDEEDWDEWDDELDEAIRTARDAVAAAPPDHQDRPGCLATLGRALAIHAHRHQDGGTRVQAIAGLDEALRLTPADHPRRAQRLSRLALLLVDRFQEDGDAGDFDRALRLWQEATGVSSAPSEDRLAAAVAWGMTAAATDRFEVAVDGFREAVTLLPHAAWHGLNPSTRTERLARWSWLTADAGASAVLAGQPELAVELLEHGRSILWTHGLNLRTPLDDLADVAPDLARRLDDVRRLLDVPLSLGPDGDGRAQLARQYDRLVHQARQIDGFKHFLIPPPFADLQQAATDGPVVLVNVSEFGSHALIVDATGPVQVVDLTQLTPDALSTHATALTRAQTHPSADDRSGLEQERDRRAGLKALAWLWDVVAIPVLDNLDQTEPDHEEPGLGPLPRLWWCPGGLLSRLPLHAAGHYPETVHALYRPDRCVPARLVSSYTPTLRALIRARTTPIPTGSPRQLTVGMPTTPGHLDLPLVHAELTAVARYFPCPEHSDHLLPPDTVQATVRGLLRTCSWVHLACHARQDPADPARSGFELTDGSLTVSALAQENLDGELAFLSACDTSSGSTTLPDEALHLAGAMQFVGYRHVLATLWSVDDADGPRVADAVYAALTHGGLPRSQNAARALHQAIDLLRKDNPADPLRWAAYVHLGP